MTHKVAIIDPKSNKVEKASLLGQSKESSNFPYDDLLKSGAASELEAAKAPIDEKLAAIKEAQSQRRKNKIPLKAKEILITNPKPGAKPDVDQVEADQVQAGQAKQVKDAEQQGQANGTLDAAKVAPGEPDPNKASQESPRQTIEKVEGKGKALDAPGTTVGKESRSASVSVKNPATTPHPTMVAADADAKKQSSETVPEKVSPDASNQSPIKSNAGPVKPNLANQSSPGRAQPGAIPKTQVAASVKAKETQPLEDGKPQLNQADKTVAESSVKRAEPPKPSSGAEGLAQASQKNAATKKTMADLTRGVPRRDRAPEADPAVKAAAQAKSNRANLTPKSDPVVPQSQQALNLKQASRTTAKADPRVTPPPVNSVRAELDGKWSKRSIGVPPKVQVERPVQKTPGATIPRQNPVAEPLNSRIGNTFPLKDQDPASPKLQTTGNEAKSTTENIQTKENAPNVAPSSATAHHSRTASATAKNNAAGAMTHNQPTRDSISDVGAEKKIDITATAKTPGTPEIKAARTVMDQPLDPQPQAEKASKEAPAAMQNVPPEVGKKAKADGRRESFKLHKSGKNGSTVDGARSGKLANTPQPAHRAEDTLLRHDQDLSQKHEDVDALKKQLQDRIELLRKTQDPNRPSEDVGNKSRLHQGLSNKTPGIAGFVPGESKFVSPRVNPPLFARSFAENLIEKITEIQSRSASGGADRTTSFVVMAGQLGEIDIEFNEGQGKESVTIFVDGENARNDLQRVIPQIEENLQQRGFQFTGLEVEIRNSHENSKFDLSDGNHSQSENTDQGSENAVEQDGTAIDNRNYGYNTMEVLA